MKTEVETLNPTRVRLSVEVPFDDIKPSLDAAYKRISSSVNIPGFRQGKVPRSLIDQRFGRGAALEEAVNDALPRLYTRAVEDSKLDPMGQPQVEVNEVPDIQTGGNLKFTAEVDVRPEFELPDPTQVKVSVEVDSVDEQVVDERMDDLRARFGTVTPVERPAKHGDFLTIDLSAQVDGKDVEQLSSRGLSYEIGGVSLLEGLDDALIGLEKDQSATFVTALVGGEFASHQADVTVTATAIRERQLPEVDEDFVQMASEFDTVEELRQGLRSHLEQARSVELVRQARDKVLEALLAQTDIPTPEVAVEAERNSRHDMLAKQLDEAGLSKQQYLQSQGQSEEEFDQELAQGAADVVRAQLLLDAVAKDRALEVEQQELTEHLVRRSAALGVPPQEFVQQLMDNQQFPVLYGEVMRMKALELLVSQATLTDPAGEVLDVKKILDSEVDSQALDDSEDA